jgi:POT family proton-dependent oligopeptide transporter
VGFFVIASSYLIVARIEGRIQSGETVSVWWQILAYVVLTASEVLVSITALEFSYKQAPLRMKSLIMALFLLSTSLGNAMTAGVNAFIKQPLHVEAIDVGAQTSVKVADASKLVVGQKIDFGKGSGVEVIVEGKKQPLEGTYLVASTNPSEGRAELMDAVNRKPVSSTGAFDRAKGAEVSTYRLVGPEYFYFFAEVMGVVAVLFIFVAMLYREKTYVRQDEQGAGAA